MASEFDPGALLGRSYALPRGPRVRLRLARTSDAPAIARLLEQQGLDPEDLKIARLLRLNPLQRLVVCATGLVGTREMLLGVGSIEVQPGEDLQPDLIVVEDNLTEGLAELLEQALVGRASALARGRAA